MILLAYPWVACAPPPPPTVPHPALALPTPEPHAWPSPAVVLTPPPPPPRLPFAVAIDPGHGTKSNRGAISSFGEEECRHTAWFSGILGRHLEPGFRVHLLRAADPGPSYEARVERANALGVAALVSIHADARGAVGEWSPREGEVWRIATSSPGFAILWSGQGELGPERERLAQAIATHLAEAGFLPYDGADYTGLYETHAVTPGVFRDLRGLYVLRRPLVPSVIVETHNALDPHEVARFAEPGVADVYAAAIAAGLASFVTER